MNKPYSWTLKGTDSTGQTWMASGKVYCEWNEVLQLATADAFDQITNGRATYGKPGYTCTGPYDIDGIVIAQVKQ